ncbi:MAG: alanine racemase [Sulfitobacter sp.]
MSVDPIPSSWCEIHLDRVSKNLELTLGLLPKGAAFCAVMKADAYGHGISRIVPLLSEQKVTCVGITSNAEARSVRDAGFSGTLLRLRAATLQEIEAALPDRVEEQVGSPWVAKQLRKLLESGRGYCRVHFPLNAGGMSRDGLDISTTVGQQNCREILDEIGQNIVGISTHFPTNEPAGLKHNSDLFKQEVEWVCGNSDLNRSELLVHAGSTLTLLSGERVETDMYRCGAILYGILNSELGFHPTMELKANVVHVGVYPKGATVGYDRDSRLDSDRRLACISIGYAAGYRRIAKGRGAVLICDKLAPVLGKISMNSIIADVTEIPNVQIGDIATVFGTNSAQAIDPKATMDKFGTILPDLFSDWGIRNPRIYR